jgi:hypothetical protein
VNVADLNEASFRRVDAVLEALAAGDVMAAIELVVVGDPERERVLLEVWRTLAATGDLAAA